MATEDITRSAFYPAKRYDSVRMQQGRVLTDDDYNETEVIDHEDRRRHRVDIIGPAGTSNDGFRISTPSYAAGKIDFQIAKGSMYVGGIRAELEADVQFGAQPDHLRQPAAQRQWNGVTDRFDLVYLEVWQQPVSAVEDGELFETALGGPDTAVRVRTMFRVHRFTVSGDDCVQAWQALAADLAAQKRGTLDPATGELVPDLSMQVDFMSTGGTGDLCTPAVLAGYLGANNTALRVALVPKDSGSGADGALVWGLDNAAPIYRVKIANLAAATPKVEFTTLPADEAHWPLQGQIVEILPWSAVLPNGEVVSEVTGQLAVVQSSYDRTSKSITLTAPLDATLDDLSWTPSNLNSTEHLYLRVWDRSPDHASPAKLEYLVGTPVPFGDTGIEVTVWNAAGAAAGASTGADAYWVIAARPEVPDQVVPWELRSGRRPEGIRRFYAPLGIIHWKGGAPATSTVHDCRPTFQTLTRLRGCCSRVVGDGVSSFGDFSTIQAAIDSLPADGGEICVLAGVYAENIVLSGRADVVIKGCGDRTVLTPKEEEKPVLTIEDGHRITLRSFAVEATDGHAIVVSKSEDITLCDLAITSRDKCAVLASDGSRYAVLRSRIKAIPLVQDLSASSEDGRWPAVFVLRSAGIRILDNEIVADVASAPSLLRVPRGGLQIGGASSDVEVRHNRIVGGNGNGITLGSVSWSYDLWIWVPGDIVIWIDGCLQIWWGGGRPLIGVDADPHSEGLLEDVLIAENDVRDMSGDGIGVARFFTEAEMNESSEGMISVRRLILESNRIIGCLQAESAVPEDLLALSGHGGVALADVEVLIVRDNIIENNGRNHIEAVCGVFVLQGRSISIENNRIAHNGPRTATVGSPKSGARGGIFLPLVGQEINMGPGSLYEGTPALRVHDNVVVSEESRALYVVGQGTMSIVANQLVAKGRGTGFYLDIISGNPSVFLLGSAVEIQNFGLPSEVSSGDVAGRGEIEWPFGGRGPFLILFPGGDVLFNDNHVTLDLSDPYVSYLFSSVAITTYDDLSMVGNQLDVQGDYVYTNTYAAGWSVRTSDNRFREGTPASFSLLSYGVMNTTMGNQGTHCIIPIASSYQYLANFHNLVRNYLPCQDQVSSVQAFFQLLGLSGVG